MRTRKTTMLEKMIPEPLTRGLFTVARCRAYVDALAMVVQDVHEQERICTNAANKAAAAFGTNWKDMLACVDRVRELRQTAKDASYGAKYMAGIAVKAASRIRKSNQVHCAVFDRWSVCGNLQYGAFPAAARILDRADAMAAECKAKALEIGQNAEQPDGLGILEGMARMNLGLPIPKRCRAAGPLPSQRASGQRAARKAGRQ